MASQRVVTATRPVGEKKPKLGNHTTCVPLSFKAPPVEIELPKNSYENPHPLQATPEKDRNMNAVI